MSSFKKLSKADISTVLYTANKSWSFLYNTSSLPPNNNNIIYYKGKKEDFHITGSTTTRGQYQSLIYDSINHLFYQSYNDTLNTSSLMFNVETYESASEQRPTSSYFNYNTNPLLIKNFPTSSSSGIVVLSVNKNVYGNKILPHSFRISSSLYDITDDGNGNLYHTIVCNSYELGAAFGNIYQYQTCSGNVVTESVTSSNVIRCADVSYGVDTSMAIDPVVNDLGVCSITQEHVGNIFYAHGIAVITNQNYLNLIPPPYTQSYNIYLQAKVYEVVSQTASLYYKIDNGSYNLFTSSTIYGTACSNKGTISVPSGSTLYIAIISGSDNIGFSANVTSSCNVPSVTSYCGYSIPFSLSVGSPVTVSIAVKTNETTSSFAIC